MSPRQMTIDELMNHAHECYLMSQLMDVTGKNKDAEKWYKFGKRAEYRADQISIGNGDPAFNGKIL